MDGQDYLNQISATNRPIKTSKFKSIINSKYFYIGIGAVVFFIIILIIGSILSNNKTDVKSLSFALKVHLDNTSEVIKTYQNDVKSSALRSSSASLASILSNTNNDLTNYLTEKYNFKPKEISNKITDQATLEKDGLESELFEAKINGILDRIYAHKMTYQISLFTTEEARIINATSDEDLKNLLSTSYDSLLILYDSFNNFSETN